MFVSTQINREKEIINFIKVAISKNKEVKFCSNHSGIIEISKIESVKGKKNFIQIKMEDTGEDYSKQHRD